MTRAVRAGYSTFLRFAFVCTLFTSATLLWSACKTQPEPEPWMSMSVADWPPIVLTNRVEFADATVSDLANAFLVDIGDDTVAVTAKHLFLVLREHSGVDAVDLGADFVNWDLHSPRDRDSDINGLRLLNSDPQEEIGDFNSLKVRDWLIFDIDAPNTGVSPLRMRTKPLRKGQTAYAIGRSRANRNKATPSVSPLRVFQNVGPYYFVEPLDPDADPVGTSGSPVVDEDGLLVGIVSGATGNMGIICGVDYLRTLLKRHGLG